MNNTRKWLLGIGIVAGLCVAACGVIFLVVRQAGTQLGQSLKTDATGVAQVGAKIADFDLPPGYVQGAGMSIFMYDFVVYEPPHNQQGMSIMLMQFKDGTAHSTQQMQQALQQQSGQLATNMKVVSSYETTIRKQTSTVLIEEGTSNSRQGVIIRELFTTFPGNGGTVMLMMVSPKDMWNQSLADHFIASIR